MQHCLIVTPVYNDWKAFSRLMQEIEAEFPRDRYAMRVLAMDDCSIDVPGPIDLDGSIVSIEAVRLTLNLGHQRAIAIGLVEAEHELEGSLVAIMDSDGEDQPADLRRLIDAHDARDDRAIVARRSKRSESLAFRAYYILYVRLFQLLTGHRINFGNFSVLSRSHLRRLVHNPNIWNNYAATLLHARIPMTRLPTVRGKRYAGRSQMRFISLILHGLGAISVFTEAVLIRTLIASAALFVLSVATILSVLVIRLFTDAAIPGWTTNVLGFAFLLSAQACMLPILLSFIVLGNRSAVQTIPAEHARRLVERREVLYQRQTQVGGLNE